AEATPAAADGARTAAPSPDIVAPANPGTGRMSGSACFRRRPGGQTASLLAAVGAPDDVDRPLLDLGIDPAEILADDADAEKLDAAEEQDADDQRRVAWYVDSEDQRLRHDDEAVEQRQARDRRADI